ncbi:MAG TPA: 2-succinyl-5-enolpyruvyl-6-hydroxy-3-cyclohexene-1-carboxylic-acid synthase [Acidimicrobiia bacterium]
MTHPNPATALARVVVDELVAGGVRFVAIAPGSRSGALAIAAAKHADIESRVVIDERSAAFWALGVARASGRPAAVVATSGTAPANFFPAVVEADMAGVPLVAISADRPVELRGVGANQTIDQVELFGPKVRAYREIEAPEADMDGNRSWRLAVRALLAHASGRPMPGPVHLNVAFREPTVPVADDGRTEGMVYEYPTPRLGVEIESPPEPDDTAAPEGLDPSRGLVIAGDGEYDRSALADEARRLGWPVVATALSGMRGSHVVSSYRYLLDGGVPGELKPRAVIAVGAIGPDLRLEDLVAEAGTRVRVDRWGRHIDPGRNATSIITADPVDVLRGVRGSADESWERDWHAADAAVRSTLVGSIEALERMSGGAVAHAVNRVERGAIVAASSLPVREVDAHLTTSGPVFANRGASGIDGFVSTALGVASVIPGTIAIAGDLSLLHDANGFLHDGPTDLTLIVVDNSGGGLFDSLPQASHAPQFERLFITPPDRALGDLLRFHGARVETVNGLDELIDALDRAVGRPGLDAVVVPVDREYDLEVRSASYR